MFNIESNFLRHLVVPLL